MVAFHRSRKGKQQRNHHRVKLGFVVIPLEDAALADIQPGMDAGDMPGCGGGELGCPFGGQPVPVETLEEWVRAVFFKVPPAKPVNKAKQDVIVLALEGLKGLVAAEQPMDGAGQAGESAAAIIGFYKTGVHAPIICRFPPRDAPGVCIALP